MNICSGGTCHSGRAEEDEDDDDDEENEEDTDTAAVIGVFNVMNGVLCTTSPIRGQSPQHGGGSTMIRASRNGGKDTLRLMMNHAC